MTKRALYRIFSILNIMIMANLTIIANVSLPIKNEINTNSKLIMQSNNNVPESLLTPSPTNNYEIIEEMFTQKLNKYSSLGYFPQTFEPSLQATYYGLFILEALDLLDKINQTDILNYIMSHYDINSKLFMDQYAYRYLDLNFSQSYYPFTSVLEINSYAILSLEILQRLDLISFNESINFIWSCYNPDGSNNGFIGQPYNSNLLENYKIATMDNTFYAINTLELLMMGDWSEYNNEKSRIRQYIIGLQTTDNLEFGGFFNDNDTGFDSLGAFMWEPNLLSSYYSIKSLDIIDSLNFIRPTDFYQYLGDLYGNNDNSFQMYSVQGVERLFNIVATALGLELSYITGYTGINRNDVVQFLISNQNSVGDWNSSNYYRVHELIDMFQIIRSLKESGEIDKLTIQEKSRVSDALFLYKQFKGFSLISNDYTSINLVYSMINSFNSFNRITDVDIQGFYNLIEESYKYFGYINSYQFSASTNWKNYIGFRSYPIEYYNLGTHQFTEEIDGLYNHKYNYRALNSLLQISKLDNFGLRYNLMDIIYDTLASQFLDPDFENFGAFLPSTIYSLRTPASKNNLIFFENSYFAIKTLELVVDFLDIGIVANLSFNKGALYGYIQRNIIETDSVLYFNPHYTSDLEIVLQNTYYMIYILKTLNLYDLGFQKIKEFVLQNINYENIKNIYFSYKISEILDLKIEFDANLTSTLVGQLYLESSGEFFESLDYQKISQESFLWICEMARNSDLYLVSDYGENISLGSVNTITISFSNLIFREYGQFTSVTFEGPQFGVLHLEKQFDKSYKINFLVPEDPNYYPYVTGNILIYDHSKIIGKVPILFYTILEQTIGYQIADSENTVKFNVNISRKLSSDFNAVYNSTVQVQILINNFLVETLNFTKRDFSYYSKFIFTHEYINSGYYSYNVSLVDTYFPNGLSLFDYSPNQTVNQDSPESIPTPIAIPFKVNGMILSIIASIITIVVVAITIKIGRSVKEKIHRGEYNDKRTKTQISRTEKKYSENNKHSFLDSWD